MEIHTTIILSHKIASTTVKILNLNIHTNTSLMRMKSLPKRECFEMKFSIKHINISPIKFNVLRSF